MPANRPRPFAAGLLTLATLLAGAWTLLALWFQAAGAWLVPAGGLALLVAGAALWFAWRWRPGRAAALLAAGLALVLGWWLTIQPREDRDWAPDVARGVTARIEGNTAVLQDVRNFTWRSETDFDARWETRSYDLDAIAGVDLVSSTWGNPAIAHTLITFGFANGDHVTFSAEIRRERHEAFSEIGGFFKQFELVLIAADERDIVRLRTNARGEEVSLFPLLVTPQQRRALFVSYLEKANALSGQPQWYQTITANCTTIIFQLARTVEPGIPLDWRILVSGYLPDYLYEHGVIRTDLPLAAVKDKARISQKARARDGAQDFSQLIRGN